MNSTLMANPMLQQMITDPRADQMKQMMMIMGGLGQPQVTPQPPGQVLPMQNQPMFAGKVYG